MTSASTITEPSTWRREAPSVRSVANSRVRWAIVIESEFAITKAPTKSAMPPNASRKVCRIEMKLFVSSESLCACVSPLLTCVPSGRIGSIWATSCSGETPGLAATRIWSSFPTLPNSRCAVRQVEPREGGAADGVDGPELDETGDAERLDGAFRLHTDRLAGGKVLLGRRGGVDDDLAVLGPGAADERERVELGLRRVDAEAEVGGAAEHDRLAVLADQLRLASDAPDRGRDVG